LSDLVSNLASPDQEAAFTSDQQADLLTLISLLFLPGNEIEPAVREATISALRVLAFSQSVDLARRAWVALIGMREPREIAFWVELESGAPIHPLAVTIFRGIAGINIDRAFDYLQERVDLGIIGVEDVRDLLATSLPALDATGRPGVEEAFFDFVSDGFTDAQQRVLREVPRLAGLDWADGSSPDREVRRFTRIMTKWRNTRNMVDAQEQLKISREVVSAAAWALPVLSESAVEGLCVEMMGAVAGPAASIAAHLLLVARRDDELAAQVVANAVPPRWEAIVEWHEQVAHEDLLTADELRRIRLAIFQSLPKKEGISFLMGIIQKDPAVEFTIPDLDSGEIIGLNILRMRLSFEREGASLDEYAEAADFEFR
jgi:hypothetical protein